MDGEGVVADAAGVLPDPRTQNGTPMILLVILATLLTAGTANTLAQRHATHPGVEAWPR